MNGKRENRVEKIVSDLLRGRRLKLRGGDAEEKAAITMAARLAGARQGPQRMQPAFRKRLAQRLIHPLLLPLLDRKRPAYDPAASPPEPIPQDVQDALQEADRR